MVENSTPWFHRPGTDRWNVDVHGNISPWEHCRGFILPVQVWCPLLTWSIIPVIPKNPGSALPPAPEHQWTLPCLRAGFGVGRASQSKGRASESWTCLPAQLTLSPPGALQRCCTAAHSWAPIRVTPLCQWSRLWAMDTGESWANIHTEQAQGLMSNLKAQPFCKEITFYPICDGESFLLQHQLPSGSTTAKHQYLGWKQVLVGVRMDFPSSATSR